MNILLHQVIHLKKLDFLLQSLIIVHLAGETNIKLFTNHQMFNALCSIDPKMSTEADQLEPRLLLLVPQLQAEF